MNSQAIIELIRAQRTSRVEVAPGKVVLVIRPTEVDVQHDFIKIGDGGELSLQADFVEVGKYVTGWEGFTEADLVGSAGASSPAAFSTELWGLVSADNVEWVRKVAKHLLDAIAAHQTAKGEAAKN
jgi:hypothetical protein